jgi:hypothetical protein
MLLAAVQHDIETNIPKSQTSGMKIMQSAAVFQMMASVYSDPEEAIVREIIANAHDAGRFRVSLPSSLEPSFVVQDFGPSMSHEFMMEGYCSVGHSTKRGSNDSIGGFGIGRLAPLAYLENDAYTISCTQDGTRRLYGAYRGPDGVPQVSLLDTVPTNEPDGTTVKVPIRRQDFSKFEERVQKVLKWFPSENYELFGASIYPVKWHLKEETYYQLADPDGYNYVLMGPIAYQVDWNKIDLSVPSSLVPIFSVGDLDLPPSREQLQYTERTRIALRAAYDKITATIAPKALRVSSSLSPFERLKLVENLRTKGLSKIFDEYHKARGNRAKDPYRKKWGSFLLAEHETWKIKGEFRSYDQGRKSTVSPSADHLSELRFTHVTWVDSTLVYWADVKDHIRDRLNEAPRGYHKYVVCLPDENIPDHETFQKIFADLKTDVLSSLIPPPRDAKRYTMKHWVSDSNSEYFREENGLFPTEGVYVPFDKTVPESYRLLRTPWARQTKYFGLHKTAREKVDLKNFISLEKHLVDQATALLPTIERSLAARAERDDLLRTHPLMKVVVHPTTIFPEAKAAALELKAAIDEISEDAFQTIMVLVEEKLIKLPKLKTKFRLRKLLERAAKKNPTLMFMIEHKHENYAVIFGGELDEQLRRFVK